MPRMRSPTSLPDGWHRSPNDIRRDDRPLWALLIDGMPRAVVERRADGWQVSAATTDLRGHVVVETFELARVAAELALREGMASETWARELAARWSAETFGAVRGQPHRAHDLVRARERM